MVLGRCLSFFRSNLINAFALFGDNALGNDKNVNSGKHDKLIPELDHEQYRRMYLNKEDINLTFR